MKKIITALALTAIIPFSANAATKGETCASIYDVSMLMMDLRQNGMKKDALLNLMQGELMYAYGTLANTYPVGETEEESKEITREFAMNVIKLCVDSL